MATTTNDHTTDVDQFTQQQADESYSTQDNNLNKVDDTKTSGDDNDGTDSQDNDNDDDAITQATHDHPLQEPPSFTFTPDIQDQSDRSLLDDHGSPNISPSPSVINSPVSTPTEQEAVDLSHFKGMVNASDHTETVMLPLSGQLPEWLTTEHYTVGPGTYDIKYTRKIEVDGYLQSATGTFTFGHLLMDFLL
ncbi:unnamed protein product [Absidia cylindrospora]